MFGKISGIFLPIVLNWTALNSTVNLQPMYLRQRRLEEMLDQSRFAFLVLTAEDERLDGTRHARENVIHEVDLFQSRRGFNRP